MNDRKIYKTILEFPLFFGWGVLLLLVILFVSIDSVFSKSEIYQGIIIDKYKETTISPENSFFIETYL